MATKKIQTTNNYRLFERHSSENRPLDLKKHKKLLESMKLYGFLHCFPIVVVRNDKGQLIVKDGQHRLLIAETLGLPVHFVEEACEGKSMNERRDRLRNLADTIMRGKRYEAADNHVDAKRVAAEVMGTNAPSEATRDTAYHSFLAGWDAAMATDRAELLDENSELHAMVLDLCKRLMVQRCEACRGLGVDGQFESCPHCDSRAGD